MKIVRLFFIFLIFVSTDCFLTQAQIITTIAGNGVQGYSGNGGPAISASNGGPGGIVIDKSGNLYFADAQNNVISKVDPNGTITKWAGTGVQGYTGDGGPASAAQLSGPAFLSSDDQGNIYVVEDQDLRVRKINTAGIITTVAGNGFPGYTGDGGPATAASFSQIFGATPDHSGNLYISDVQNNVIRKVDASGIVTTIAGTRIGGFSGDNGPASLAQLYSPLQIGIDKAGNIYFPDELNRRIRKIDNAGIITTIAGNGTGGYSGDGGPAVLAQIGAIFQVQTDASGQIYLVDNVNSVIRKIDCSGIISTYAGTGTVGFSGDGGPSISANMKGPVSMGTDLLGNIYISDQSNYRIRKVTNAPIEINSTQPAVNKICLGSDAIFSCNNLTANSYQWQIVDGFGWTSLIDDAFYTGCSSATLTVKNPPASFSGNPYRCVYTSSCNFYGSNTDSLLISGDPVSITISTPSDSVCSGNTVLFTTNVNSSQPGLIYNWQLNGVSAGTNAPVYSTSALSDNDRISCMITNNSSCATVSTGQSNIIQMHVTDSSVSTINISSSDNTVCSGTPVYFLAAATNGGSKPVFTWEVNGSAAGSGSGFQSDVLSDGDMIHCELISSLACTLPVQSGSITMVIHALPQADAGNDTTITPGKSVQLNPLTAGDIITYEWSPSAGLDDPSGADPVAKPSVSTTYRLTVTDNNGCTASDIIKIGVYSKLKMPNAFSPDGNGVNDIFRIPPENPITIKRFSIYDRWGVRVFETSDAGKGWDGTINQVNQVTGTYAWIIEYTDPVSHQAARASGTVILIR